MAVSALFIALTGCVSYPPMAEPVAVNGSLCEEGEKFCDPVEKLHRAHGLEYLKAIAAGKPPPKTDPSRALGYTDAELGMTGVMPNARTMGLAP